MLSWIGNCLQDFCGVVLFRKGAGRADGDTLAAGDAGSGAERLLECTRDMGMEPALVGSDDADGLVGAAGSNTAAAKDTLIVVAIHMDCGIIDFILWIFTFEIVGILNLIVAAEFLKLTVPAPDTGQALLFVGGEDEFQSLFSGF